MALPLTINGAVFEYPQNFDEDWGIAATGWAQAVTNGALFLSGGNFPLTNQVDFGSSFGIKVKSLLTETANPSTSGYLALAKSDTIGWRNNANSANLLLTIDGSDMLNFNGSPLGLTSLTNGDIYVGNASNVPVAVAMSGDAALTNTGALTIANSAITNAKVSAGAAIALSKLATLTASRAVQSDTGGLLTVSSVTSTELGYLSGVTSPIQTQLGTYLPLAGGTMSGAISMASHKITSVTQGTATGNAATWDQLPGPAGTITNWAAWTPLSFGGITSPTVSAWYRRVGDTAEIRGYCTFSAATGTFASIDIINLTGTSSQRINTAVLGAKANSSIVGRMDVLQNSASYGPAICFYDGSDDTKIYFANGTDSANTEYSKRTSSSFFGASTATTLTFQFAIPIAGWSI